MRDEVARSTPLGEKAKSYMEAGELVPDGLIIELIKEKVEKTDGFLLDGFPRTAAQAEALERIVPLDLVIELHLPREEVIRRLSSRRVCSGCGKIYNLPSQEPQDGHCCEACGEALLRREDDRPDVIERRYDLYVRTSTPLLDFYRERKVLREVDGTQSRDDVLAEILALIIA